MIRVVFDTNVVVSAVLTRGGAGAHALDLAAAHKIQLYVTKAILTEYADVLRRSKFRRLGPDVIEGTLTVVIGARELVELLIDAERPE